MYLYQPHVKAAFCRENTGGVVCVWVEVPSWWVYFLLKRKH